MKQHYKNHFKSHLPPPSFLSPPGIKTTADRASMVITENDSHTMEESVQFQGNDVVDDALEAAENNVQGTTTPSYGFITSDTLRSHHRTRRK